MNLLQQLFNHPLACELGRALLHSLWQGALIGILFGLGRFTFRKRSANFRYLFGCLAMAALIVVPAITFWHGAMALRQANPTVSSANDNISIGGEGAGITGPANPLWDGGVENVLRKTTDLLAQTAPLVVALWLVGVVVFSLRLTRSCWWIRTLRTRQTEPVAAALLEKLDGLRQRLGISRPVRLLKSALVEVPTVVGWLRPVILMPAASLAGLTPGQLEAILVHELAHVRRLDYLVNVGQCVVETLMFYHPVVWWISRVVREERELCCDDVVVEFCGDRLGYARALATLEANRGQLPELAFAASGGSLVTRIRRLFGLPVEEPAGRARLGGLALLGIGLVLVVLGVCLMVAPNVYRSTVRVKINLQELSRETNGNPNGPANTDPYVVQTEFEVIKSDVILGKVAEVLGLQSKWGNRRNSGVPLEMSDVLKRLRSRIDMRSIRNTHLVEITARGDEAGEVAVIANAVASAYSDHCAAWIHSRQHDSLVRLEDALTETDERIRKRQYEVSDYQKKLNVSVAEATGNEPDLTLDAEALRRLQTLKIDREMERNRAESQINQLQRSTQAELSQVLSTVVPDPLLNSLLQQQTQDALKRVELERDLGPESPRMITMKKQAEELDRRIKERVSAILNGLIGAQAALSTSVEELEKQIDRTRQWSAEKSERWRPYFDAKREVEEMRQSRASLYQRIAAERVDRDLPVSAVQIVEEAVAPTGPSSPNRALAFALVALGLLLDLAGVLALTAVRPVRQLQPA